MYFRSYAGIIAGEGTQNKTSSLDTTLTFLECGRPLYVSETCTTKVRGRLNLLPVDTVAAFNS